MVSQLMPQPAVPRAMAGYPMDGVMQTQLMGCLCLRLQTLLHIIPGLGFPILACRTQAAGVGSTVERDVPYPDVAVNVNSMIENSPVNTGEFL